MFSWDARKASRNLRKHGVSFEGAATIFADPEGLGWQDLGHSEAEPRFKRLGRSLAGRVLLTVYTIRRTNDGKEASRKERQAYAGQPG